MNIEIIQQIRCIKILEIQQVQTLYSPLIEGNSISLNGFSAQVKRHTHKKHRLC